MRLRQEEFVHPTQASGVRLQVFRQPEGFLVTEENRGSTTVYRTLGLFETAAAAEACARARGEELLARRYQMVATAA